MKFLYSDTQDYVDPKYDFDLDRHDKNRRRYWDDVYPHELMDDAPYDGLLVAMSAVKAGPGIDSSKGRYSLAEEQRFLRDGARAFLRLGGKFSDKMLMGDCGAFAYANLDRPPYTPSEVAEFYLDAGFTHGCSPDHVIFDFHPDNPPLAELENAEKVGSRYEVTLSNAKQFFELTAAHRPGFEPVGPVQGWSPESMAAAALELERMGYRYLAVGGLVPLRTDAIHQALAAIRSRINARTKLHLLGFAKAEQIQEFLRYGIESFDSTSPMIRAFKDAKANYYLPGPNGQLRYYTAIRIPQATENSRLMQATKMGIYKPEELVLREREALGAIRAFADDKLPLETTTDILAEYQLLLLPPKLSRAARVQAQEKSRDQIFLTLRDRPWTECGCAVCRSAKVEVIIFRSSNRNKRRGIHNLGVYYAHLQKTLNAQ